MGLSVVFGPLCSIQYGVWPMTNSLLRLRSNFPSVSLTHSLVLLLRRSDQFEHPQRRGIPGSQLKDPFIFGERLVFAPLLEEGCASCKMRLGVVGLHSDRCLDAFHSLLGPSHPAKGHPEVVARLGKIRLDPQGLLIVVDRLGNLPCLHQGIGQIEVRIGIVGIQAQRFLVFGNRVIHTPGRLRPGLPQVGVGLGDIRLKAQRLLVLGHCVIQAPGIFDHARPRLLWAIQEPGLRASVSR